MVPLAFRFDTSSEIVGSLKLGNPKKVFSLQPLVFIDSFFLQIDTLHVLLVMSC